MNTRKSSFRGTGLIAYAIACTLAGLVLTLAVVPPARAERIKDLAQVAGVRGNPLVGYGLVVGLDGSGDRTSQTPFTVQSLKTLLSQLGVTLPPGVRMFINVVPLLFNVRLRIVATSPKLLLMPTIVDTSRVITLLTEILRGPPLPVQSPQERTSLPELRT